MLFFVDNSGGYYAFDDGTPEHYYANLIPCPERPGQDYVFDFSTGNWNYVEPVAQLWAAYQAAALVLLNASDLVVICTFEEGIVLPPAWKEYRSALRTIVGSSTVLDYQLPLPVMPSTYPTYVSGDPNLANVILLDTSTQVAEPVDYGAVQLTSDGRDGMLALQLTGPYNALTIKLPQESVARPNQIRKIGTSHNIASITWLPYDGDTTLIYEAPAMLNAEETCVLQHTLDSVWTRIGQ